MQSVFESIDAAAQSGKLSETAVSNIKVWLTEDRYSEYRDPIVQHVQDEKWQALDDAFWTIIPFGTGGRRGRMYEFGSNAINDRTIGESAQGLADYVVEYSQGKQDLSCAIAYDTRHNSRHFAELCAGVMVAAGFKVYFLDDYRATPQLSFAVRYKNCDCGIMVTASHNPPSDNAVKVYWSSGAQVLPPHDKAIIERVMTCDAIESTPFEEAVAAGKVEIVTSEIDEAFLEAASACGFQGPRDAKILYSPLHGVGAEAVIPLLKKDGFTDVEVFALHEEKSGDFPNVPENVSNPENHAVFDKPIEYGAAQGFDVILATDPDCDRLGVAAPLEIGSSEWGILTGNQIGAVLADYILTKAKAAGTLSTDQYIVTTLVTTGLLGRICDDFDVRCVGDLLVGFKHIAAAMDANGPDQFLFGTEESHGYLVGQYARDKDGAVACMLMSELVADLKSQGRTVHQYLADLHAKHGYHQEQTISLYMEGSEGMAAMKRLMAAFRSSPPKTLAGLGVSKIRDYANSTVTVTTDGSTNPLSGPVGEMIIMDLDEDGNYVAARPSGTEPKIKLYIFTRLSPDDSSDLAVARQRLTDRIADLERDLRAFADTNSQA